jgi:hypothetical protein
MLHPQRKGGAFKQLGARLDVTARYVWHWNRFRSGAAISMASSNKKHLSIQSRRPPKDSRNDQVCNSGGWRQLCRKGVKVLESPWIAP